MKVWAPTAARSQARHQERRMARRYHPQRLLLSRPVKCVGLGLVSCHTAVL